MTGRERVRQPAVAGSFYPGTRHGVEVALDEAFALALDAEAVPLPKALVVPHAGWVYSGPVAATAYRMLEGAGFRRVVLIGPSHFVPFRGLAVAEDDAFATPLGRVPLDAEGRETVLRCPDVVASDVPHAREHSLEVQLPFLQRELGEGWELLPLAVGFAEPEQVAAALGSVWGGDETLLVISTDLSHYLPHELARERDARTAEAVVGFKAEDIADEDACGSRGLRGFLVAARDRGMTSHLLDLRTSGDTSGDRSRVVGYGAFAFA